MDSYRRKAFPSIHVRFAVFADFRAESDPCASNVLLDHVRLPVCLQESCKNRIRLLQSCPSPHIRHAVFLKFAEIDSNGLDSCGCDAFSPMHVHITLPVFQGNPAETGPGDVTSMHINLHGLYQTSIKLSSLERRSSKSVDLFG